jgi:glycosyltransferase involved in cell wall biosynthesis
VRVNNPLVSCVISSYNRARLVPEAIDSALAQTYSPLEVIVVDDGSTDDTPQALAAYGDHIHVIRQKNAGTAAARNAGLAAASGEFVAWLDSDDAWLPGKIAAQVAAMAPHSDAAVVYTKCQPIDESGHPPPPSAPIDIPPAVIRSDILRMLVVESEVMPSSCLVRRAAIDAVGGFDPAYVAEDWELHFRLARAGRPFLYLDAPLTRYRVHDQTKSKDKWGHALAMLNMRNAIEAARPDLLAADTSPAMVDAYARHRRKYADAYYRVGKLSVQRGDVAAGAEMLRKAIRLNPWRLKYHTRYWQSFVATGGR